MIKIKLKRFSICLLAILALLCFICSSSIKSANAGESPPKVYANDISVKQGNYAYVYIKAENFVSVGSLELYVYYDSSVFNVYSQSVTGLIRNEMVSTDVATPGEAELFMASAIGVSGDGDLWVINFKVNSNAPVGTYPVTVAVGEANDINFAPISVETQSFYINVTKKAQTVKRTTFVSNTPNAIGQGESTNVYYYVSGHSNNFASGKFEINYDSQLLSLDKVEIGAVIANLNGAITSVNEKVKGCVVISFAALGGVQSYIYYSNPLFTFTFTALENVDKTAEITMDASALYDYNYNQEPNAIEGNSVKTNITILYEEPEIILPKIYLSSYDGYDSNFVLDIVAEKQTSLAAADFVVTYDTAKLSCISVQKVISLSTVVANIVKDGDGKEIGQIKFSFLLSGGITDTATLAQIQFDPVSVGDSVITLVGNGLRDGNYAVVLADCFGTNVKLSHEIVSVPAKEPTSFESGWHAYEQCKHCGYSSYEEIPALGVILDETIRFGHSCSFHNNLTMNYYVPTADLENYQSFYLGVEKDVYKNKEWTTEYIELKGELTSSGYKFVFKGIGAAEAGNELRAVLYAELDGNLYKSKTDVYSVKEYAYNRLEKSTDAKFKTLLVDMLNYCSAAQTYFGVNVDNLVNADLTETQKALATATDAVVMDNSSKVVLDGATAQVKGKSIVFNSNIEAKFYLDLDKLSDLNGVRFTIEYVDGKNALHKKSISSDEFVFDVATGCYTVKYIELNSADLRAMMTVKIEKDGTVISDTVNYSVETYVYNMLNKSTNQTFKALLKELIKYSDSANKYFYKGE